VREAHNVSLPSEIKVSPVKSQGRRCYYVWGKNKLLNVTRAENQTVEVRVKRALRADRLEGVVVKMGIKRMRSSVKFQLIDDYKRNDGGAIVFRVYRGPREFRLAGVQSWKVRTMNGVPAHHQDWRMMLREELALGSASMVLEGPIACNQNISWWADEDGETASSASSSALWTDPREGFAKYVWRPPCHIPCATFQFIREPTWSPLYRADAPAGVLREESTGQCLSHMWQRSYIFWFFDLGIGLVDCAYATKYRLRRSSYLHDVRFCDVDPPHDCQQLLVHLNFANAEWHPYHKPKPTVSAVIEPPAKVAKQLRRMISLFWHCKECRERFNAIEFNPKLMTHPRHSVLWWWSAHRTISSQLQTADDAAKEFPFDPAFPKNEWPPQSLCPQCWDEVEGGGAELNEIEVYHFMVGTFYAAPKPKHVIHSAHEVQQEWASLPEQSPAAMSQTSLQTSLAFCVSAVTAAAVVALVALQPRRGPGAQSSTELSALGQRLVREVSFVSTQRTTSRPPEYVQCATVSEDERSASIHY